MVSRKRLYDMFCDLSIETDLLFEQLEELQKEVDELKKAKKKTAPRRKTSQPRDKSGKFAKK